MLREDLLDALKLVKPALSGNQLVPLLNHYWFLGDQLAAYDGQIAIQTAFDSGFVGAVPDTLVALLSASRAKEVTFAEKSDSLTVTAAGAKFKLPFLPLDRKKPIFAMPKPDPSERVPVDVEKLVKALSACKVSLGDNPALPHTQSIKVEFDDDLLYLYSTNDQTITRAIVKTIKPGKCRAFLSGEFCRQMLAISRSGSENQHLEIRHDYAIFVSGATRLFGNLPVVDRGVDFDGVIKKAVPETAKFYPVSPKLEYILDRAVVVAGPKKEASRSRIIVRDGQAHFFTRSARGEVRDTLWVASQAADDHHPDIAVTVDPNLFRVGLGFCDRFTITDRCVAMQDASGSALYLASASIWVEKDNNEVPF